MAIVILMHIQENVFVVSMQLAMKIEGGSSIPPPLGLRIILSSAEVKGALNR